MRLVCQKPLLTIISNGISAIQFTELASDPSNGHHYEVNMVDDCLAIFKGVMFCHTSLPTNTYINLIV